MGLILQDAPVHIDIISSDYVGAAVYLLQCKVYILGCLMLKQETELAEPLRTPVSILTTFATLLGVICVEELIFSQPRF